MSEWTKPEEKKNNVPDDDFRISMDEYKLNLWFAQETWKNLQASNVQDINIHIEESVIKPRGCIAWICSRVGNKSIIPVSMNIPYEEFKKRFRKAGGIIFQEIKYLENKDNIRYDKPKSDSKMNLADAYKEMKQTVTNLPYERNLFEQYE